jgi:ABC-type dipeptide/oligopeptide/nickel transport system permease component
VIQNDFLHYFINSVLVTVGTTIPTVVLALMAAFAIVRGAHSKLLKRIQSLFLMGLAIPLQAAIIPIYLVIIKLGLYDTPRRHRNPVDRLRHPPRRARADQLPSRRTPATCSSPCDWTGRASGRCSGGSPSP